MKADPSPGLKAGEPVFQLLNFHLQVDTAGLSVRNTDAPPPHPTGSRQVQCVGSGQGSKVISIELEFVDGPPGHSGQAKGQEHDDPATPGSFPAPENPREAQRQGAGGPEGFRRAGDPGMSGKTQAERYRRQQQWSAHHRFESLVVPAWRREDPERRPSENFAMIGPGEYSRTGGPAGRPVWVQRGRRVYFTPSHQTHRFLLRPSPAQLRGKVSSSPRPQRQG